MGLGGFNRSLTFSFISFGSESCPSLASLSPMVTGRCQNSAGRVINSMLKACRAIRFFDLPALHLKCQDIKGYLDPNLVADPWRATPKSRIHKAQVPMQGPVAITSELGVEGAWYVFFFFYSFSISPTFLFNSWFPWEHVPGEEGSRRGLWPSTTRNRSPEGPLGHFPTPPKMPKPVDSSLGTPLLGYVSLKSLSMRHQKIKDSGAIPEIAPAKRHRVSYLQGLRLASQLG